MSHLSRLRPRFHFHWFLLAQCERAPLLHVPHRHRRARRRRRSGNSFINDGRRRTTGSFAIGRDPRGSSAVEGDDWRRRGGHILPRKCLKRVNVVNLVNSRIDRHGGRRDARTDVDVGAVLGKKDDLVVSSSFRSRASILPRQPTGVKYSLVNS